MELTPDIVTKINEIHSMLSVITRPDALMSKTEVAAFMGVTTKTVDRLEREGSLRRVSEAGHPRYRRSEVEHINKQKK